MNVLEILLQGFTAVKLRPSHLSYEQTCSELWLTMHQGWVKSRLPGEQWRPSPHLVPAETVKM